MGRGMQGSTGDMLPVDVGESVGVMSPDGDLHHNSSAVIDHRSQLFAFHPRYEHRHHLITC